MTKRTITILVLLVAMMMVGVTAIMPQCATHCADSDRVDADQFYVAYNEEFVPKSLIPTPLVVEYGKGLCRINSTARVVCRTEELMPVAHYLGGMLSLEVTSDEDGAIRLGYDPLLETEEYRLIVDERGTLIVGGGYGGVFNGAMTLLQMLPEAVYLGSVTYPVELPLCRILDRPRWEHRGFMLDVCRTWMDKEAVKQFIDLMAYHKLNSLRLHLTDDEAWRIEIESHPELALQGGFRGGDSPIWPRYGKWNERWGGYYTKADMREIIEYANVRNIEIVPEIDLPGHSLCIATLHPEILCNYTPDTSRAFGYDTRSAFCPSKESNYELLSDILGEVCELFPSKYIHIGGDEVDMVQWRKCPDCSALMRKMGMESTQELQQYFMSRVSEIIARYDKFPAVWNEAIDGGRLSDTTRVYGWESIKECRKSAAEGYPTVLIPGEYFYFDMKQSSREPGHDWAAIFDWTKVYGFTPQGVGFTDEEARNIVGIEASFFSEVYASHVPETDDYLHYQLFPRLVALAEVVWVESDERDNEAFYERMVAHYDRLDAMGVAYRLMPPVVKYSNGVLSVACDDGSQIYYTKYGQEGQQFYTEPIKTEKPAHYLFVAKRCKARSQEVAVVSYFKTITPAFNITSSMPESEKFTFDKAEGYGRLARTQRAADVGDWVMFTFDNPVTCRCMKVATGNFQLPRYLFENGYVEVSYDGANFERVGELDCGMFYIEQPSRPIKAVRMVCTSRGNGAEWVSIQPPTIYPML